MLRGMSIRLRAGLTLAFSCTSLLACASDTAPEPEPALNTPGAFVAVDEGKGALTLHRSLSTLRLENDTILFLTIYDVQPSSWAEAREISKRHDLPILHDVVTASMNQFPAGPHRVVWFRTLTKEEAQRAP
jgi:hypothetical protein